MRASSSSMFYTTTSTLSLLHTAIMYLLCWWQQWYGVLLASKEHFFGYSIEEEKKLCARMLITQSFQQQDYYWLCNLDQETPFRSTISLFVCYFNIAKSGSVPILSLFLDILLLMKNYYYHSLSLNVIGLILHGLCYP